MPCYDQTSHCYIGCGVDMSKTQDRTCIIDNMPALHNRRMFHKSFDSVTPPWAIDEKSTISRRSRGANNNNPKLSSTRGTEPNTKSLQVSMSVDSLNCPRCGPRSRSKETQTLTIGPPLTACVPLSANPNAWINTLRPGSKGGRHSSKSQPNLVTRCETLPKLSERRIPPTRGCIERAQINLKKNYITRKPFSIRSNGQTVRSMNKARPIRPLKTPPYCRVNPYDDETIAASSIIPADSSLGKRMCVSRIFRQVHDYRPIQHSMIYRNQQSPVDHHLSSITLMQRKIVDLAEFIDIEIEFLDKKDPASVASPEILANEDSTESKAAIQTNQTKASNIRNKFENNQINEKPGKVKRPAKVKYAGLASVKNRLMEDVEKVNAPTKEDRGVRQITPPRNGVSCGILESEPQARAPGVVSADDDQPDDITALAEYTKNLKAKFKQMEAGGQQDEIKKAINAIEEFEAEAVRARRSIWKDMESGRGQMIPSSGERKKINLTEGVNSNAGVYENEPEVNPDIVRCSATTKDFNHLSGVSAKEKLEMLLNSADLQKVTKINPADELKLLAELEKNSVHENKPAERSHDVVASDQNLVDDYKTLKTAKSTREKFLDGSIFQQQQGAIKKTVVEITNEAGGVYENEPSRRPDVVRYDDSPENEQVDQNGKWASEAKRRLLEQQKDSDDLKNKVNDLNGGKFATEARERFLQKQKELEESQKNKPAPKIIDIWSDLPACSGVYENQPAQRSKDIVVCGQSSDEEEDVSVQAS